MAGHKNVYDLHNLTAQPRPRQVSSALQLPGRPRLALAWAQDIVIHKEYMRSTSSLPLSSLLYFCVDKELINYGPYIMEIYRCCLGSLFYGPAEFYDPWQSRLFIDLLDGVANFEDSLEESACCTRRSAVNQGQRACTGQQQGEEEAKAEQEAEGERGCLAGSHSLSLIYGHH